MMTARTFISGFYYVAGFQLVFVTISKIDFIVNGVNTVKGVYKVYTVYTFLLLLMILATEVWLMPIFRGPFPSFRASGPVPLQSPQTQIAENYSVSTDCRCRHDPHRK
jgi:hypothetical protein